MFNFLNNNKSLIVVFAWLGLYFSAFKLIKFLLFQ